MARGRDDRREAILAAGLERFSLYGFRRTSMDDIAAEAGISRAAVYLDFPNKEAIFRTLSQRLGDDALARAEAALAAPGPIERRVRGALEGKNLALIEVLYGSPHGAELLDEGSRLCGDLTAASERRFHALLAGALRGAAGTGEVDLKAAGLSAAAAADLLIAAARGLKSARTTAAVYRRRLAALVRVFLAGIGARPKAPRVGSP